MINQDSGKMIEQVVSNLASLKLSSCGIAVSGGSDSIALFHIITEWEAENKPEIFVASVDHGLRSESKAEVQFVKKICEMKGVKHFSLKPTMKISELQGIYPHWPYIGRPRREPSYQVLTRIWCRWIS